MKRLRHRRAPLLAGIFVTLAAIPASSVAAADFLALRPGVPDAVLARIRGGLSAAGTFWTFAIVRTVTVNDTAVLKQELRIDDLAPLIRAGILPQVTAENLGAGVAIGSGNSLADAISGQIVTSSPTNAAAKQAALQPTVQAASLPASAPAATSQAAAAVPAPAAAPQAPAAQAPAPQAAPQAVQAAAPTAVSAQPAAPPASNTATASLTTPTVVSVPTGNGTIQVMVMNLPNAGAILQNTIDSVNLGVKTSLDVNAKLLDAARSGLLRQQIIDSLNLPH